MTLAQRPMQLPAQRQLQFLAASLPPFALSRLRSRMPLPLQCGDSRQRQLQRPATAKGNLLRYGCLAAYSGQASIHSLREHSGRTEVAGRHASYNYNSNRRRPAALPSQFSPEDFQ